MNTPQRLGFSSRVSPWQRLAASLTAIAFAILVSIAASHLHVGAEQEDGCAVCAAFAGKLEGPSITTAVVPPAAITCYWQPPPRALQVARSIVVVLPPSCGPPRIA